MLDHGSRHQSLTHRGELMKVSSVSLCEETYPIAKSMPNFSSFVRECLRRWRNEQLSDQGRHLQPIEILNNVTGISETICNPFSHNGLCVMCWPHGGPKMEDWGEYRKSNVSSPAPRSLEWIQKKAEERDHREAFHMTRFSFDRAKPDQDRKTKRGLFARVLSVFNRS